MTKTTKVLGFMLAIVIVATAFSGCLNIPRKAPEEYSNELKTFSSYDELKEFIKNSRKDYYGRDYVDTSLSVPKGALEQSSTDYSTTNIQVQGVDEADIVKSDGEYLYVVANDKIVIVKAYPESELKIVSEIKSSGYLSDIFLNKDVLIAFDTENYQWKEEYYDYYGHSLIKVYDVSDKSNPKLTQNISYTGYYFDSRMIGDYVYVIANQYVQLYYDYYISYSYENKNDEFEIKLPIIRDKTVDVREISYFDVPGYSFSFTSIISMDIKSGDIKYKVYLTSTAQEMYVSTDNIYLVNTNYYYSYTEQKTIIHKISISDGIIKYYGMGEVLGYVLNQFSMDEYNQHFRVATTVGEVWSGDSTSNVYVLDKNLNLVGKLEGLAKGEEIYSARFIKERCYLVTFKKVDPLFVIDLSNVSEPKVLGYLKIPGYSDYLHPYDENHIIGIGKNTVESEEGNFAWYQGIKIALFDISDVSNPKEIAKYEIGDRGTDSEALHEHKAFLFSKTKNLLSIPITLAEINESQYSGEVPPNAYGEYVGQYAYVFSLTLENGFVLKGKISHNDYYDYQYRIRRILYIEDNLYTISEKMIKVNKLSNLEEVGKLEI